MAFTVTRLVPKIRRRNVPAAALEHLRTRMLEWEIGVEQMGLFARWLNAEAEVPAGRWFKRFPGVVVCGNGEMLTTFLRLGQVAAGEEVS